jgi:hypothetical protein
MRQEISGTHIYTQSNRSKGRTTTTIITTTDNDDDKTPVVDKVR